jgi:hypothetical protein
VENGREISRRAEEKQAIQGGDPDRTLTALCSPCSRPSHRLSGPPSSASPFLYPYRVIGMVMIAFVGVATFDKSGEGAISIL